MAPEIPHAPDKPRVFAPEDVTPPDEWRAPAREGFVVELPSGKKARLKRTMNLAALLESGKIPNPLARHVREMMASRNTAANFSEDPEALQQFLAMVNTQVKRIFVQPRIEQEPDDWATEHPDEDWEPSEGAIALTDVDYNDRMFAFAFAQGMATDLEAFRSRQAAAMATVEDVARLTAEPSADVGPDGPVPGVLSERSDLDVGEARRGDDGSGDAGEGEAGPEVSGSSDGIQIAHDAVAHIDIQGGGFTGTSSVTGQS